MIHTLETISIRRYGEIDRREDLSLLRRWFNPLPVAWFNTDVFFSSFNEMFGKDINKDTYKEAARVIAYNRIIILDRIIKTMSVLMRNQNERSIFILLFKQKSKNYTGNLKYYIEKAKQLTGITVKDGNDLKKLEKETQRLLDKFNERYNKDVPTVTETLEFIDIALGVFLIMEMAYIPEMKLAEFGRLKLLADKRVKSMEKKK